MIDVCVGGVVAASSPCVPLFLIISCSERERKRREETIEVQMGDVEERKR